MYPGSSLCIVVCLGSSCCIFRVVTTEHSRFALEVATDAQELRTYSGLQEARDGSADRKYWDTVEYLKLTVK